MPVREGHGARALPADLEHGTERRLSFITRDGACTEQVARSHVAACERVVAQLLSHTVIHCLTQPNRDLNKGFESVQREYLGICGADGVRFVHVWRLDATSQVDVEGLRVLMLRTHIWVQLHTDERCTECAVPTCKYGSSGGSSWLGPSHIKGSRASMVTILPHPGLNLWAESALEAWLC